MLREAKEVQELRQQRIDKLIAELGYDNNDDFLIRPGIHTVFMNVAKEVAERSPDAQTKVGAVIVTPENRILSTGYNGYPRDIDYSCLPNTRPKKYPWFLHAERNALAWCEKRPIGCRIYTTLEACNDCLMACWQHGITEVHQLNPHLRRSEEDKKIRKLFLELSGMIVVNMMPSGV